MEEKETNFSKVKNMISDTDAMLYVLQKKKKDIFFWFAGIIFILLIFIFISSKDYSFFMILSAMAQNLGFIVVVWKVWNYHQASGLSLNSIVCYLLIIISRLMSTLFYPGYLPSDEAGDWFYQLIEIISLISLLILIFMIKVSYRDSYDSGLDTISWLWPTIPTLALAALVHTNLNGNIITDTAWTFSMYLETFAILPQISLFVKKGGNIEPFTSHYVALQGLSRVFSLIFWATTYQELYSDSDGWSLFPEYSGIIVIFSQVIQILIMIDYYYHYFKGLFKGEQMNFNI